MERDGWPISRLRELQAVRCARLMQQAMKSSYWRRAFEASGVDPTAARPLEELAKLSVLDKTTVKVHRREILASDGPISSLHKVKTSGTTGGGLVFWESRQAEYERWATWWRYRSWHGIDRSTWCGQFGGRLIVPREQEAPPYWRSNPAARQVLFSVFHLRPETAPAYVDEIRQRELRWLHGYPSALSTLASFVVARDLAPVACVDIVTLGAENVLDQQKELISRAFDAEVRQHYGLQESVANISECERGTLHVDEDFALVEFLPDEGRGEDVYRIVGTNLSNPAFPLFRYDTGDRAVLGSASCECPHPGRTVVSLDGREEDIVVLPDGTRLGRLDHIFKDFVSVREAQIYQSARDRIELRVVPDETFDEREKERLLGAARQRLGDDVGLEVTYLDRVPRTESGKLRFVVSDVA